MQYAFMDADSYVYIVSNSQSYSTLNADKYATLTYAGFNLPETIVIEGKTLQLNNFDWCIYGDFTKNTIIVVRYKEEYRPYTNMLFFAHKGDICTVINKRRNPVRQWLRDAKAQLEATKDREGKYHLFGGGTTYNLDEEDFWPLVAAYANAQYSTSRKGAEHD